MRLYNYWQVHHQELLVQAPLEIYVVFHWLLTQIFVWVLIRNRSCLVMVSQSCQRMQPMPGFEHTMRIPWPCLVNFMSLLDFFVQYVTIGNHENQRFRLTVFRPHFLYRSRACKCSAIGDICCIYVCFFISCSVTCLEIYLGLVRFSWILPRIDSGWLKLIQIYNKSSRNIFREYVSLQLNVALVMGHVLLSICTIGCCWRHCTKRTWSFFGLHACICGFKWIARYFVPAADMFDLMGYFLFHGVVVHITFISVCRYSHCFHHACLSLSAEFVSHSAVFFSYNKLANRTSMGFQPSELPFCGVRIFIFKFDDLWTTLLIIMTKKLI